MSVEGCFPFAAKLRADMTFLLSMKSRVVTSLLLSEQTLLAEFQVAAKHGGRRRVHLSTHSWNVTRKGVSRSLPRRSRSQYNV